MSLIQHNSRRDAPRHHWHVSVTSDDAMPLTHPHNKTYPEGRLCASCNKTILSRYNATKTCGPCAVQERK